MSPAWILKTRKKNSESKSFSNFISHTLLHHNAKSIHKFSVKCGSRTDQYDVQSWVFMAISRNAQELNVSLGGFQGSLSFYLARCVLTCNTLVSLKLCGRFKFLTSVCLPNLKTLDLDSVVYNDDESVRKLVSCCSVLENLSVRRQRFDNVNIFHISASALKRLSVDFQFPIDSEFLHQPHVLEINAPALEYLYTRDYLSKQLVVANFGSLIKADVVLSCHYSSYSEFIIKRLEALGNVKFLSLSVMQHARTPNKVFESNSFRLHYVGWLFLASTVTLFS